MIALQPTKYKHIVITYESPPKHKDYFISQQDIVDVLKTLPQEHLSNINSIELRRLSQAARERSVYQGRYVTSRKAIKIFPQPTAGRDVKYWKEVMKEVLVHEIGHHHGEKLSGKKDISEKYADCYLNAWKQGKKDLRKFRIKEQQCLI